MIYDEGFEFNLGQKDSKDYSSYFLFLKYSVNDFKNPNIKTTYLSHCYEALTGWYHTGNNKWGCFFGHKLTENYSKATNGEALNKMEVTEASINSNLRKSFIEMKSEAKISLRNKGKLLNGNFSGNKNYLTLNSEFSNHEEVVSRINSMNLSWKAEVYNEFKGKSIEELNNFNLNKKKKERNSNFNFNFNNNNNNYKKNSKKSYGQSTLSKNFLKNFLRIF